MLNLNNRLTLNAAIAILRKATVFTLWMVIGSVLSAVAHADNSLAPGRVGKLVLGMSLEQIYSVYPKELTKKVDGLLEEDRSPVHEVYIWLDRNVDRDIEKPSLTVRLDRSDGGMNGVEVRDPRFKTAEGIGVGSSLGQLRRAHKDLYYSSGEGSLSAVVDGWKMAFRLNLLDAGLDEQTLKQIYATNSPWPHELKDDPLIPDRTKITSIWVYRASR